MIIGLLGLLMIFLRINPSLSPMDPYFPLVSFTSFFLHSGRLQVLLYDIPSQLGLVIVISNFIIVIRNFVVVISNFIIVISNIGR